MLTFTLIALQAELGKMSRMQIAVLRLEGTTLPKYGANARRVVTFLSATELKYSNPGSTIGGQLDVCGSATSNAMLELVRAMRDLHARVRCGSTLARSAISA